MVIPLEGQFSHIPALLGLEGRQEKIPSSSAGRFQCFKQIVEFWESHVWELSTAWVFVQKESSSPLEKKKRIKADSSQTVQCVSLKELFPSKSEAALAVNYLTELKRCSCLFLPSPPLRASLSRGSPLSWCFLSLLCDSPSLRFVSAVTMCCSALRRGIISNLQRKNLSMEQGRAVSCQCLRVQRPAAAVGMPSWKRPCTGLDSALLFELKPIMLRSKLI